MQAAAYYIQHNVSHFGGQPNQHIAGRVCCLRRACSTQRDSASLKAVCGCGCCLLPLAVNCILQWSLCKELCPQCKHPFDYLLTHKQLDGTVTDFLTEESVVLLKRARWFEEYMRVSTRDTAPRMSCSTLPAAIGSAQAGVVLRFSAKSTVHCLQGDTLGCSCCHHGCKTGPQP